MARTKVIPDEFQRLLSLIRSGKLFTVQEWIKEGKPLRSTEFDAGILSAAVDTGFHSLVEELLQAGGWSSEELGDALETARRQKRFDIAELLATYGAKPEPLDFADCCQELDLPNMERHLRTGTDPNANNAFAQALCSVKARPLLGFYRQFRAEFPTLDDQAALALCEAVQTKQVRWTALLVWAGADPFRPVPNDMSGTFPVGPEDSTTAAKEAVYGNHPEILKVLHLKPTSQQAIDLLEAAAFRENEQLFRTLLSAIPSSELNHTPRKSCAALETLVRSSGRWGIWNTQGAGESAKQRLRCMELLLDSGARWNPAPNELRYIRRALMEHEARYIVQVLRLLLYTPGTVEMDTFLELCRSQTLEAKIASVDAPLVQDLRALRKNHQYATGSDAAASKETAASEHKLPGA